ncbi:sugar phosphate isomerase/epimerase family protein, partial [Photobacterium sanctipauli]
MKLSICTISFRHQLVSLDHLAQWAKANKFDGIELWGVHARGLMPQVERYTTSLAESGLAVSMLSDYIPLLGERDETKQKCESVCQLAAAWQTRKIRTFAGHLGSRQVNEQERNLMANRLRFICEYAADSGLDVLVETHPQTLADNAESVFRLLEQVNHPSLKINFDTLHVWEAGDDPVDFHRQLGNSVGHYHLKNIASRHQLSVFAPDNVYSPAGTRKGMVPLLEGA